MKVSLTLKADSANTYPDSLTLDLSVNSQDSSLVHVSFSDSDRSVAVDKDELQQALEAFKRPAI